MNKKLSISPEHDFDTHLDNTVRVFVFDENGNNVRAFDVNQMNDDCGTWMDIRDKYSLTDQKNGYVQMWQRDQEFNYKLEDGIMTHDYTVTIKDDE